MNWCVTNIVIKLGLTKRPRHIIPQKCYQYICYAHLKELHDFGTLYHICLKIHSV